MSNTAQGDHATRLSRKALAETLHEELLDTALGLKVSNCITGEIRMHRAMNRRSFLVTSGRVLGGGVIGAIAGSGSPSTAEAAAPKQTTLSSSKFSYGDHSV